LGIEGTYLSIINAVYDKPILNGENWNHFLQSQEQYSKKKERKEIQIQKEELKLFLLADDMLLYFKAP
jgi:hypothetical protein